MGSFNVKLRGQNCENTFFINRYLLNEDDEFENMLNNDNLKKTITKMNDVGWKSLIFQIV